MIVSILDGEVIFFRLTDVGRSIDLRKVARIIPAIPDKNIIKTKNTPSYVDFPEPLIIEITQAISTELKSFHDIIIYIKVYSDGVISLMARLLFTDFPHNKLHTIKKIKFKTVEGEFQINNFLKFHHDKILNQIRDYIEEEGYIFGDTEYEKYTIFCLTKGISNPKEFVQKEGNYFSALLNGENPNSELSQSQIKKTLDHTFSFLKNDLAIFDFERAIIIDQNSDYEDILLATEIANYQLLELRTLDKLLDRSLAIAEEDIRNFYFKSRRFFRRIKRKVGRLIRLHYDLLFLLENIENVSKLIGDYYLAQIYRHIAELFQLKQWSDSIRHRLETLEDIYNITQSNSNERFLLLVEILLTFIFIMEFILLILDFFLS
ncbi:MAG: hypothetical protein ACFFD7_12715 [Candidatus Thorarchaeota archaeon]